jgi:hypothetical protein
MATQAGGKRGPARFEVRTVASGSDRKNEGARSYENAELKALRNEQRGFEERLGSIEERLQDQKTATRAEPAGESSPQPSEAEAKAQRREQHAAWKRVHAAEARDATWAQAAERRLQAALLERPEMPQGFQVLAVDCRTTRCDATLSWPSYTAASQSFEKVLTTKMGCASSILLDDPEDPTKPYQAHAHYDCEGMRAESPEG